MIKKVWLDLHGLKLVVAIDVSEDSPLYIEGIMAVYAEIPQGHLVTLKCDTTQFLNDLEVELYQALERAIADERIAYYEMKMDAKREEGL